MTSRTLTTLDDLTEAGLIAASDRESLRPVANTFSVAVPTNIISPTNAGHGHPALLRQFVPDIRERLHQPEELDDPIGDGAHEAAPGIVHRYDNKLLLKVVSVCPVYCRFCFRRDMLGGDQSATLSEAALEQAFNYIASKPQVTEVILTGGDPLILSPRRVEGLTQRLAAIAHVQRLRWHSRIPVLQPHRISSDLARSLTSSRLTTRIAVHCNHAAEVTIESKRALKRLQTAGISLLSQSVLLRGINDNARALADVLNLFSETGISPYYLHQLDLARGTSHFRVSIRDGLKLMRHLRSQHPGIKLPSYMLDLPGGFGKVNLETSNVSLIEKAPDHDLYRVRDRTATWHTYRDFCTPNISDENPQPTSRLAEPSMTPVEHGSPTSTVY
jgi:lysine 2,3-aminomutase